MREVQEAPCGLLETILEMRAYAHAKRVVQDARTAKDIPPEPIYHLVHDIEGAIAAEDLERRRACSD